MWANQMPELKKNTKDELGVIAYPGDPKGAVGPRLDVLLGLRGSQEHRTSRSTCINFLVNDPEAGKILGTDRGLPSNLDVRKAVADDADRPEHEEPSRLRERAAAPSSARRRTVPPKGHSKVRSQLIKAAEKVQYGQADAGRPRPTRSSPGRQADRRSAG